jgi:hypothetical protein
LDSYWQNLSFSFIENEQELRFSFAIRPTQTKNVIGRKKTFHFFLPILEVIVTQGFFPGNV